MYLSRIQLNPQRRDARWLLSSPQRVHAAVLAAFPEPPTGDRNGEPRVLWRLDEDRKRVFLYVVSPDQPDFAALAEQAGWPTTERGVSKPYDPFLDRLTAGQRWAFRLAANPTQYKVDPNRGIAKRVGHVSVKYQVKWLLDRAARYGFAVAMQETGPDVVVSRRSQSGFGRREPADGSSRTVTLSTAQYDGVLEVVDADALRSALLIGIGPAKAYGCGLLTLASGT